MCFQKKLVSLQALTVHVMVGWAYVPCLDVFLVWHIIFWKNVFKRYPWLSNFAHLKAPQA